MFYIPSDSQVSLDIDRKITHPSCHSVVHKTVIMTKKKEEKSETFYRT